MAGLLGPWVSGWHPVHTCGWPFDMHPSCLQQVQYAHVVFGIWASVDIEVLHLCVTYSKVSAQVFYNTDKNPGILVESPHLKYFG